MSGGRKLAARCSVNCFRRAVVLWSELLSGGGPIRLDAISEQKKGPPQLVLRRPFQFVAHQRGCLGPSEPQAAATRVRKRVIRSLRLLVLEETWPEASSTSSAVREVSVAVVVSWTMLSLA